MLVLTFLYYYIFIFNFYGFHIQCETGKFLQMLNELRNVFTFYLLLHTCHHWFNGFTFYRDSSVTV